MLLVVVLITNTLLWIVARRVQPQIINVFLLNGCNPNPWLPPCPSYTHIYTTFSPALPETVQLPQPTLIIAELTKARGDKKN